MGLRRGNVVTMVAGAFGFAVGASALAIGCGSSGPAQTGPLPLDSGTDSTTGDADASEATEAGTNDGSAAADSTPDSPDGAGSGEADASEAGPVDAGYDGPSLADFPHAVDQAYCGRLQTCCEVPDAAWKTGSSSCVSVLDGVGGILRIGAYAAAFDSGAVVFDTAAAMTCLNDIATLNCGTVPATTFDELKADCFAAMVGTLGIDAGPCINPLQCTTGEFCRLLADGGAGVCVALGTTGQPCNDPTYSTDCSYLGNGGSLLYCGPGDGGNVCQPQLPVDAGCTQNPQCQSGACNYPMCVSTYTFSDPGAGICADFTIADAGDGG